MTITSEKDIVRELRDLPENTYAICQVKTGREYHLLRFSSLDQLKHDAMRFRQQMHNESVALNDQVFNNDVEIKARLMKDGFHVLPQTVIHLIPVQDDAGRIAAFCVGHGVNCCWVDGCDTRELDSLVHPDTYDLVCQGPLTPEEAAHTESTLENLFMRYNTQFDPGYTGRSMSVSDVVVLNQNGNIHCYYVEPIGFHEIPDFLSQNNPLRNAEMSVEDDYDMIDGIINNGPKKSIADELKECRSIVETQERPSVKKAREHTAPEHD